MGDFGHGTGISLTLGVDITPYITSVSSQLERAMAELRHLGADSVERLPGLRDSRMTLEGDFEPVLDAALWDAWNGDDPVEVVYGPQGDDPGKVRYTFQFFCSRYSPGPAGQDAVKASAELVGTGDVDRDVFGGA